MNTKGILIAIEGEDGCGKATQSKLLFERLNREGFPSELVSFPNYASESSWFVRNYLNGTFGDLYSVNAYTASIFYAMDRYASYRMHWKEPYNKGKIIIADRYTPSNLAHQIVKLENMNDDMERVHFITWLADIEHNHMQLPYPNLVILLSLENSASLIEKRSSEENREKDIHEKDLDYLKKVHDAYQLLSRLYGYTVVQCNDDNGGIRSIKDIHEEIYTIVKKLLSEIRK